MTRLLRPAVLASALLVSALSLSACGNSATGQTSASPSTSSPTKSAAASSSPSASAPSSTTAAPPPSSNAGGLPARCVSTQLSASLGQGAGGAAGHVYAKIVLTNTGSTPCLLSGFAGLSLTNGPTGDPIGAPADRDASAAVVDIVLNPGQAGAAEFGYTQPGLYAGSCTQVQAAGLRIYPPEDYGSLFIANPQTACSEAGVHLLTLKAFQPM